MSASDKKTNITKASIDTSLANDGSEPIVESLYKKNIELVVKNKTLSLLSKLYEISILTLEPKDLAVRASQTIQVDLSFELVGIFMSEVQTDSLKTLAISSSTRIQNLFKKLHLSLEDLKFDSIEFFKKVIKLKKGKVSNDLEEIWNDLLNPADLKAIISESNIKTTLLYPLTVENKTLGIMMLALNRSYESLTPFEKESIKSFVNLIALALEKALLYKELESVNTQLREFDHQKDELLSMVSHQLAAPITAIKWYLELFTDGDSGKLSPEQTEQILTMQSVTSNLSDLVSMILDVSRIQMGKIRVDQQDLNLSELIDEIVTVVQPKIKEKDQEFVLDVPKNLPILKLDRRLTRMIIENLLTNAIKYSPKNGKVQLIVNLKKNLLTIEVADNGCGIPEGEQDKIFSKLYRASNVRNTFEGNGFGLYVVKGAVEAQEGKISFSSKENEGTTFNVELPIKPKITQ